MKRAGIIALLALMVMGIGACSPTYWKNTATFGTPSGGTLTGYEWGTTKPFGPQTANGAVTYTPPAGSVYQTTTTTKSAGTETKQMFDPKCKNELKPRVVRTVNETETITAVKPRTEEVVGTSSHATPGTADLILPALASGAAQAAGIVGGAALLRPDNINVGAKANAEVNQKFKFQSPCEKQGGHGHHGGHNCN